MENSTVHAVEIPEHGNKKTVLYSILAVLFAGALIWSGIAIEIKFFSVFKDLLKVLEFVKGFLTPSFSRLGLYLNACLETLSIALWGTFLATIFAIPLGFLGASNMAPNPVIYHIARRIMDVFRAVNELVFALIFVVAVGLGPFSGMMALAIHTCGVLGKLLSETIESIDEGQVEGVSALGTHKLHVTVFGVVPQVLPNYLSYVLLRFESNVRSATVVGMVGGGGIGFYLWETLRSFQDSQAATILLLIVLMVVAIDFASKEIRREFI